MQETKFECEGESCYYKDNLESTVLLFFVFNKSFTDIELMFLLVYRVFYLCKLLTLFLNRSQHN